MSESNPSASLPPPPSTGAPGYDNNAPPGTVPGNGQGGNSHMPPPALAPVIIPQNTNPIPTAISSPMSGNVMSPASAGGYVRRAAPEPNKRALYVGGLDPRVTEEVLRQIFETAGHVQSVKIIPDKNYQSKGFNYGFIEFDDPGAAERSMQTLNGRRIHQSEIRVNWAYQSNSSNKEDTSSHFHIFVGDLSNEVNDEILTQAFSAFGNVSEARVMWDMKTGRSRGYGFVAFRDRSDADKALNSMDGEWLGSRAIRCNWANQKGQPSMSQQQAMASMGMTPTTPYGHHHFPTNGMQSYEMIVQQTPQWQTTCYVGNLTPYTSQQDLVPLFQNFGYVVETRFQSDRGFAFIKMDTHENAAMAICQLNGYQVNGRPLKCSWGKDRPPTGQFETYSPAQGPNSAFPQTPSAYFPQYGGPPGPMSPQGTYNSHYPPPPSKSHCAASPPASHYHPDGRQSSPGRNGGPRMDSAGSSEGRSSRNQHGQQYSHASEDTEMQDCSTDPGYNGDAVTLCSKTSDGCQDEFYEPDYPVQAGHQGNRTHHTLPRKPKAHPGASDDTPSPPSQNEYQPRKRKWTGQGEFHPYQRKPYNRPHGNGNQRRYSSSPSAPYANPGHHRVTKCRTWTPPHSASL
ncbi:hypothetical protein P152DRAFT_246360 [Eremomyces bilateralis CBS 781.70]|uniref:RRM domain-containing protein n=1 Tax=Eremomyces bilateralis CBS 781.70 TaxID=1392243 RepID=A0A6G1GB93_9PEZI|nr:uncharacterized protein P152DRAFT_246360 [Eremomyces bilateralis CBS 781.70]KAF1815119.1 hypothetical protein P152DRAFT_246360 [Eremomyces bilateralis CBS 781.70]